MQEYKIDKDAPVLIPNKEYKNFTATTEVIPGGTVVRGEMKYITGMKDEKPFTYEVFHIGENKFIFLKKALNKKTKNNDTMEKTEIKLGADGGKPATIVSLPSGLITRRKVIGLVVGAGAAFMYCKYKKHDNKKSLKYAIIGAAIGYATGFVLDARSARIISKAQGKQ